MILKLACGVITDKDGRVLLVRRNRPNHVQWELPGGKIDEGEDPVQTAVREIKEELGVAIEVVKELGQKLVTEYLHAGTFTNHFTWYAVRVTDGEPQVAETGTHDDLRHFSIDEMRDRASELSASARDLVQEIDAGRLSL
jgi:8-oxo-dGTP diphosphatase